MRQYKVSSGIENLADKLKRLSSGLQKDLNDAGLETAVEAQAVIVDIITNKIEPHSGLSRRRNPQEVVTDLVDTGFYRASWSVGQFGLLAWGISSNAAYAAPLEYGNPEEGVPAYYVARRTALEMAPKYQERCKNIIERYLK